MWGRQAGSRQVSVHPAAEAWGKTCKGINWAPGKDALLAFEFLLRRVQLRHRLCRRCLISIVVIIVRHVLIFIFFLALHFVYVVKAIQVLLATGLEASPNGAIYAQEARCV